MPSIVLSIGRVVVGGVIKAQNIHLFKNLFFICETKRLEIRLGNNSFLWAKTLGFMELFVLRSDSRITR